MWVYLLLKVNWRDGKRLKRGQGWFLREEIHQDCNLKIDDVGVKAMDGLFSMLKKESMVKTVKTPRGFIVTILNYDRYQSFTSYRSADVSASPSASPDATQVPRKCHASATISNICNKDIHGNRESNITLHPDTIQFGIWWTKNKQVAERHHKWLEYVNTVFAASRVPLAFAQDEAAHLPGTTDSWDIAKAIVSAWQHVQQLDSQRYKKYKPSQDKEIRQIVAGIGHGVPKNEQI